MESCRLVCLNSQIKSLAECESGRWNVILDRIADWSVQGEACAGW